MTQTNPKTQRPPRGPRQWAYYVSLSPEKRAWHNRFPMFWLESGGVDVDAWERSLGLDQP